ncbi:MAG: beta-lactamase family protein [Clostridiaceae bacterium]|jgi:CubicO group peptidase (beta-lactamase class C family)|nr:beta-lactamase family protein [Clostridiaceae bacterium]
MTEKKLINDIKLPRASSPEAVGVSSQEVEAFLDEVERQNLELRSFMVIRHGVVAAECFREPFTAEYNHQMWSISKSFTATALGIAIGEGYLTLDTRVTDIFPEYRPKKNKDKLEKLTVRHLVMMTAGKSPAYLMPKTDGADWVKIFINSSWYNEPGAEFRYINENFYMICAILRRLTGQTVTEYLTPRLFEPLGIVRPFWETDNTGTEAGGWGLYVRTEDLAKLILCYQRHGEFGGKQIIPAEWTREATKLQTPCTGVRPAANYGYGYGFWLNPVENSYRANGLFSQFGMDFTDYDGIFVCNAAVMDETVLHNLVFKHFPAAFADVSEEASKYATDNKTPGFTEENGVGFGEVNTQEADNVLAAVNAEKNGGSDKTNVADATALKDKLVASAIEAPPKKAMRSPFENELKGKKIRLRRNLFLNAVGFPIGVLPIIVTAKKAVKQYQIDDISLNFDNSECRFSWREGRDCNEIALGLDGAYREGQINLGGVCYRVLADAEWTGERTFEIRIRAVETIAKQTFRFDFGKSGRVTMRAASFPKVESIVGFLRTGAELLIKFPPMLKFVRFILRRLPKHIEPPYKGKMG